MTVAAVMMAKDESDIIETTVRHLLTQVDEVIVADNLSSDGTYEILQGLPVDLLVDDEVGYYQAAKTTRLAYRALEHGHSWVVPCDADEIWYSNNGRVSELLELTGAMIVTAEMFDHVPTTDDDPNELDPVLRIGWRRRERGTLPKVACRLDPNLRIAMGNHSAHYTDAREVATLVHGLVIRHFPYRSEGQFVKKAVNGAAAYKAATDLPESYGGHWRGYGEMVERAGEQAAIDWFHAWFHSDAPPLPPPACRGSDQLRLIYDPAPVNVRVKEAK